MISMILQMMINTEVGAIRTLLKQFDRDYYKPTKADDGFAGRKNNYIEYKSKGNRYENLLPKEYLNIIKPYLRDFLDNHKLTDESNNEENDRAEWKIQLVLQNKFISHKGFEDTQTIYSASESVEIFMGSDTNYVINRLFNTILERIKKAVE